MKPHDAASRHLMASAPACAILPSSFEGTPDTPMPPTTLPSTTIGTPPSIRLTSGTVKYRSPAPPAAMTSSSALVGRRNSTAVRALPSAIISITSTRNLYLAQKYEGPMHLLRDQASIAY